MCLRADVADLGPADAVLDEDAWEMIYRPGLTVGEQTSLARRLLDDAGIPQPTAPHEVRCRCGKRLTVLAAQQKSA